MPAQKPQRPDTGILPALPRVTDEATQRALDQLALSLRQVLGTVSATNATVGEQESGRLIGRQILTGSGTYTPTAGTCVAHLREIGGGGGGGGAAGAVSAGAGGSSGVMLDIRIGTPGVALTGGAYASGSGGAAGTAAGGNGGTGGDSTIVLNGVTYTAKGGGGGTGMAASAGNNLSPPTAPAAGTTAGGVTTYGLGATGNVDDGGSWFSGAGGASPLGAGGLPVGGTSSGNPGLGLGGGGSGGASGGAGRAGGAGADGGFIIEEYA